MALREKFGSSPTIIQELERLKNLSPPNPEEPLHNNINLTHIELPVQKRRYHALLGKYVDRTVTDYLYHWLHEIAGMPIWYDAHDLPPISSIFDELPNVIIRCRCIILIVSKSSISTELIKAQYEAAIEQQTKHKEFRILPIRIDDSDISPDFRNIRVPIDLHSPHLDLDTAYQVLFSLYYNNIGTEFDKRDLYISRTWREGKEAELADHICRILVSSGFRLIGDSNDQESFYKKDDQERIRSIISSCGGVVSILPDRGQGTTSDPIIKEIQIALDLKIPCLIITEPNVHLPSQLDSLAIRLEAQLTKEVDEITLQRNVARLNDEWRKPSKPYYIFFATDFSTGNEKRNRFVKEHIQLVTSMECTVGDDIKEVPIQQTIVDKISHAFAMIADISEGNINTIIEAGIAIGAGLKENLHLIAKGPRCDPHFMFSDKQIQYYADESELLGIVHKIAYGYRRRVLNYEFSY